MHTNCDRLLVISVGLLFLFIAFNTAEVLATKVLKDNDFGQLGFYSLGIIYGFYGFFCLFSTTLVHKLGERMALVLGTLCYVVYIFTFVVVCWYSENDDNLDGMYELIWAF